MYLLENIPAGVCGAMPGMGLADILQKAYEITKNGDNDAGMNLFEKVLPHIVFILQNLELFLYMDIDLLVRRNLLSLSTVRSATLTPDAGTLRHADWLTQRVLRVIDEFQAN